MGLHSYTIIFYLLAVLFSASDVTTGAFAASSTDLNIHYLYIRGIEVIKKLESARTPASLAATDAGTRSAHW